MALTQIEAAKLTQDMMLKGVISTIVRDAPVLSLLPFMDVVGTAVTYNRETTMPAATFYNVGDTWTEATPTFTQIQTALKIMGGDADVDNFLQQTYANPNDLEAEVVASRAKAVAHLFSTSFWYGDTVTDPKSFDGLTKIVTGGGQEQAVGVNGGAMTLPLLDEVIDKVKPGKPDALFMTKRSRRQLSALRRASGVTLETSVDQFGQRVTTYDGIPIYVDDFLTDTETQGSSGAICSSVWALKFGQGEGVMGLQNAGIQIDPVGELETKDATRWRVKWYTALAVFSNLGVARLKGITA